MRPQIGWGIVVGLILSFAAGCLVLTIVNRLSILDALRNQTFRIDTPQLRGTLTSNESLVQLEARLCSPQNITSAQLWKRPEGLFGPPVLALTRCDPCPTSFCFESVRDELDDGRDINSLLYDFRLNPIQYVLRTFPGPQEYTL